MQCYQKDYPRPQFVRREWMNLNGEWAFCFDDEDRGEQEQWYRRFPGGRRILVPFTYETPRSGIGDEGRHDCVWYHRTLTLRREQLEQRDLLLHFEGSDFETKLWVNGQYAGSHRGGYDRFTFSIAPLLHEGDNDLTVRVEDRFDTLQPRGKQRWADKSFACWYVQTTGIWKTVWAESVPRVRLDSVKMTPDLDGVMLALESSVHAPERLLDGRLTLRATVRFGDMLIARVSAAVTGRSMALRLDMSHTAQGMEWEVKTWSPEHPNLYDVRFELLEDGAVVDDVGSYFAMRDIRVDGGRLLLNGQPLYQRLVLDQGYWADTHLTPPDEDALIRDIDSILRLGFNGVRKHQKIEDERFLYWCDVKGLLVWSEMAAAYRFTDDAVEEFTSEWLRIVRQNYNHPCIIVWTPFNESWGVRRLKSNVSQQRFTQAIHDLTRSVDPMRPVITNDGWEHTVSDLITLHDYDQSGERLRRRYAGLRERLLAGETRTENGTAVMADGYAYQGQPLLLSEFGGAALGDTSSGWGYGDAPADQEAFLRQFEQVVTAVQGIPCFCGYCYTQITDVQQEINGLMDMHRNFKADPDRIREINLRSAE